MDRSYSYEVDDDAECTEWLDDGRQTGNRKKADSDKYIQQCDEGGKGYTIEAK